MKFTHSFFGGKHIGNLPLEGPAGDERTGEVIESEVIGRLSIKHSYCACII
jgi:hypothetical protein